MNKDRIVRFLAYDGRVSVICSNTKQMIEEARKVHDLTPTATAVLGRVITATAMMAVTSMKEECDGLTVQINGRGPIGSIIAVANNFPKIKAYVDNSKVELPLNKDGKIDVGSAVGTDGFLNVITQNDITSSNYNGMVPLVSGEIAEDFAEYFAKSKQKPSAIALGVLVDRNGVKAGGGYMITLMPDATEEIAISIENAIAKAKPISQLLEENISLEEIAKMVTGDENVTIIEDNIEPKYECDCNKKKFERGLISLGKEELQNMIDEDGEANTKCHFCHTKYNFTKEELENILKLI